MATMGGMITFAVPARRVKACLAICKALSVLPKGARDWLADHMAPIMARWIAAGLTVVRE